MGAFFLYHIEIKSLYLHQNTTKMTVEVCKAFDKRIKEFFPLDNVELYTYQDRGLGENPLYHAENWLIEFLPILWNNNQNSGAQSGVLQFIVHHISHTGYADQKRIINTTHFVKHHDLMKCLQNWSCTPQYIGINISDVLINRVIRIESSHEHQLSNLIISRHRFSCVIFDYSALKQYQEILADLRLEMWLAKNMNDNDKSGSITLTGLGD
jgi:hypothetical protein